MQARAVLWRINCSETPSTSCSAKKKSTINKTPGGDDHAQVFSFLGSDQRTWLKANLEANKDKTHILIVMHCPIYPKTGLGGSGHASQLDDDSRKFFLELLKNFNIVAFVFASHQNMYCNHNAPENLDSVEPITTGEETRHMVSGGVGAWQSASPNERAFYHYLKVTINGPDVTLSIERTPKDE